MLTENGAPSGLGHTIARVVAELQPEWQALSEFLDEQVAAFEPEVRDVVRYTLGHSGKRIRPALVFLAGGDPGLPRPWRHLVGGAAIVELVHLATLVHDDILDKAEVRHRTDTVARRFGEHTAVLAGDALFAQALVLASQYPDTTVCRLVAEATRQVCSGEIAQTFARGREALGRADYHRLIALKTGELFAVSAHVGAHLGGFPPPFALAARAFALNLGIAYQIFDDLTDVVASEARAGKTLGTDLATGKLTLPLFVLLDRLPPDAASRWRQALLRGQAAPGDLRGLMENYAVVEAVEVVFLDYIQRARRALEPFPDLAPARQLPAFADALVDLFKQATSPATSTI